MKNIKYLVLINRAENKQAMIMKFNAYYKINWLNDDSLNFRELNHAIKYLTDKGYIFDFGSFLVDSSELRDFKNA